jgi:hypothetical protein
MVAGRLRATAAIFAAVALMLIASWMWETRTSGLIGAQLLVRVLAIAAAWRGWIAAMFVLFTIGFFPVGIYLLGSPSFVSLAGIADLLYLGTTIALFSVRLRQRARTER